jgi:Transcription factor WhiB
MAEPLDDPAFTVPDGIRTPCAEDPEQWFSADTDAAKAAKAACWRCPLLTDCRAYALRTRPPFGVWGGLTPRERGITVEEQRHARVRW